MAITIIGGTVTRARNATYISKTGEVTKYDSKGRASRSSGGSSTKSSSSTGVYDPKTGRELSPFEVSGLAPATDAKTGQTVYYSAPKTSSSGGSSAKKLDPTKNPQVEAVKSGLAKKQIENAQFVPLPVTKGYEGLTYEQAIAKQTQEKKEAFKQANLKGKAQIYKEEFKDYVYKQYNYYRPVAGLALFSSTLPAGSVGKATGAAKKGISTVLSPATTAYANTLSKLPYGAQLATNFAASTGATYGVTKGVSAAGKGLTNKKYRAYFGSKGEQGMAETAYKAGLTTSTSGKGITAGINRAAAQVPILDAAVIDKKKFESGVRAYASEQGLNKKQTEELVIATNKYAKIRRASFGSGLAAANTFSEIGGQVSFATSGKASFANKRGVFTYAASKIAPQGVIEGTSSVIAEQAASGKNFRTFKYGSIAAGGLVGGVSAGVIGGGIVASQTATTKTGKFAGKALIAGSNIADPYESVGDFLAETGKLPSTGLVRTSGTITLVPSITKTTTKSTTSTPTVSKTLSDARNKIIISNRKAGVSIPSKPTSSFTGSLVITPTKTFTSTYTPTKPSTGSYTPSKPRTNPISFTPTPAPVPTPSDTFTPTPTPAPTPSNTFTPTNTFTNTFINTRTSVSTRTTTSVPVKTFTPDIPMLPFFPKGGGGRGFKFPKLDFGKKFYTPTATAAFFGIKGKKPSKGIVKSGLGFRPIVSTGKGGSLFGSGAKF